MTGQLQRQHDVLERIQRRHEVKRLEHEADALGAHPRAAVLVEFRQIMPFSTTWPVSAGRGRPAAPAASICRRRTGRRRRPIRRRDVKLTSLRMVRDPSGLLTCLLTACAFSTLLVTGLIRHAKNTLPCCFVADCGKQQTRCPTVLIFGDSLSAGYGIDVDQSWAALLQQRLEEQGLRTSRGQRQHQRRNHRGRRRPHRQRHRELLARR